MLGTDGVVGVGGASSESAGEFVGELTGVLAEEVGALATAVKGDIHINLKSFNTR